MIDRPPLRVALLGAGGVARMHVDALAGLDSVHLVAVADPHGAADFAVRHGIPTAYASLADMLDAERLDVVHLCTPPDGHAVQARAIFAAGAHVITEKPPALSLAELDTMLAAAERADRQLAVIFQQRSGSAVAHVKALLGEGRLGRPLLAACQTLWYRDEAYYAVPWRGRFATEGGGTTLSHGIHQVDLLGYLLGDWQAAWGRMWRLDRDIETEDTSTGVVTFAGGVLATVTSSVLSPRQLSSVRIDTTRATIELEHLYGHGHQHWRITPAPGVDAAEAAGWAWPEIEVPSGHRDYLRQVYAALAADELLPPVAGAPSRSMEIVTALYASARRGGAEVTATQLAEAQLRGGLHSVPTDLRPGG